MLVNNKMATDLVPFPREIRFKYANYGEAYNDLPADRTVVVDLNCHRTQLNQL